MNERDLYEDILCWYNGKYKINDDGTIEENNQGELRYFNSFRDALVDWENTLIETNIDAKEEIWSKEELDFIKNIKGI